jgi:hypothetical protein
MVPGVKNISSNMWRLGKPWNGAFTRRIYTESVDYRPALTDPRF